MRLLEFYNKVDTSVGVAKILFNYLSQKYPSKKIKDIAKTTSGGTPNRSISAYYGGNIAWIKSGELNDTIIMVSEETITEDALKNSSAKLYPKGTLVLALYGATVGKTGILGFEAASNQAVCAVYPEKGISKEYLFWFFRQKRFEYIQQSFGGAQPNISQDVVKNTEVPIPPLEIQENVQKLLFHIEKTKLVEDVRGYAAIIPQLKEFILTKEGYNTIRNIYLDDFELISHLRKSILQEAVSGKLVPQDPKDEPASELLKKIKAEKEKLIKEKKIKKDKPLPPITKEEIHYELPGGWVWARLQDVFDVRDGTHDTPKYVNEGFPLVTSKNIYNGKLDMNNIKYISNQDHIEISKRSKVDKGDIIFAMIGSIGNPVLIDIEPNFSIKNVALFKFYNTHLSNSKYLLYFLRYAEVIMKEKSSGAVQSFVALNYLREYLFPLPPLFEQKRIVEKVDQLMKLCDELETRVKENQKNSELLMEAVLREAFEV